MKSKNQDFKTEKHDNGNFLKSLKTDNKNTERNIKNLNKDYVYTN